MEEKKTSKSDMEKLTNADPATLRARVLELESHSHELTQLLNYREDVILRIHEVSLSYLIYSLSIQNSFLLNFDS